MQAAGLWSLVGGGLTEVARWDVGPASVLVPTEDVLLLAVELPMAGAARRRAALPFAVEDRIAEPLDVVHLVLGGAVGTTTYLVAVVRHDLMLDWVARLAAAGLDHARLVPDALLLPLPAAGTWHVTGSAGRVVARTDTGIGLAVAGDRFAAMWSAGGSLPCVVLGDPPGIDLPLTAAADAAIGVAGVPLGHAAPVTTPIDFARSVVPTDLDFAPPADVAPSGGFASEAAPTDAAAVVTPRDEAVPLPTASATLIDFTTGAPPLDLRAGPYAAPPGGLPRAVRRAMAVVALGLVAHTAVLAADAWAATTRATAQRTATVALVRATLPGTPATLPAADLDRLLPGGHGALLPLLVQTAAALGPVGGLGFSRLGWSAADNRLTLGIEAGDIAGLQRAQAALAAAGLDPASGAVTAGEHRAEGEFVVRAHDA